MHSCYVIFSALYPPHVGGIETYTQNLARELARQGERAVVVTSAQPGAPERERDGGIDIVRLPSRPLMGGRFPLMRRGAGFDCAMRDVEAIARDAAAKGLAIRVFVNARFYPLSVFGARWAREHGVVPVILDHGSAHLTAGNALIDRAVQTVEHAQTRRQLRSKGAYYGVSRASCAWLKHFGIASHGVLPNAIDAESFRAQASTRDFRSEIGADENDLVVAFTGRLEPEKGPDKLVEALSILKTRASGRTVRAVLAGEGSMRTALEDVAPDTVVFSGSLDKPDVAALLLASDVFCLPTRSEGFSTSLLEAAACGCACVITDVGGVAELMGGAEKPCGIILADTRPKTVASALARFSDDPAFARTCALAARSQVDGTCTWEATARAVIAACEDAQRA